MGRPGLALLCLAALCLAAAAAAGAATIPLAVRDGADRPSSGGRVVICPEHADCHEAWLDAEGRTTLASELLTGAGPLTILVYDHDGVTRWVATAWTPSDAERRLLAHEPGRLQGRLVGRADATLSLSFTRSPTSAPADPAVVDARRVPRLELVAALGRQLGDAYTADDEALGGVTDVSTGPRLRLVLRPTLPARWPPGRRTLSGLELSLRYDLDRYTVRQRDGDGVSDLGLHRVAVEVGVARLWRDARLSAVAVVSYAGVYDGTDRLEYAGRTYGMPGVGLGVRGARHLITLAGRRLALLAEAGALYDVADTSADDHWHGLAPALMLGVAID
jgi:hypothetical protein